MNTKTFEAIEKLKEIEIELHRLKNALEMANKALDAQRTWVDLTDDDIDDIYQGAGKNDLKRAREVIAAFKGKNT